MSVRQLTVDNLYVTIAGSSRKRIAYILSPSKGAIDQWADAAAGIYDMTIAVVSGMDWDNDLTPWPAPGVPRGEAPFAGRAGQFRDRMRDKIIPAVESEVSASGFDRRDLVGISLSGLFTVWQWVQCDLFDNIASLSGSFWYDGFVAWLSSEPILRKHGIAVFLLGNKEQFSPVKEFRSVAVDTESVVADLNRAGITTYFKTVPGNHYQHGLERLTEAFGLLYG